ncbi:MAG: PEP/pyruvate-binding domain-containing protein, partial [Sphaerochaetaceae bacterium]
MHIYPLDDIDGRVIADVGGKARGLYRLSQAKLPIEPGFVVHGLTSAEDIEEVLDAYESSGYGFVAVRSSATDEDGAAQSHAGQYESVLNVQGRHAVKEAIDRCLASLGNGRATTYARNFARDGEVRMN